MSRLITTAARIIALDATHALIECGRASACVDCGGCIQSRFADRQSSLARLPIRLVRGAGPITAQHSSLDVGDDVVLGLEGRDLLRAAAAAYGLPLAGLIGMSCLAAMFAAHHDALGMAAGFAGLVLGWLASGAWSRRREGAPETLVVELTPMEREG